MKDIVIILTHDRPEFLQVCLEHVIAAQPNGEVWICEDQHSDAPKFAQTLKDIKTVLDRAAYDGLAFQHIINVSNTPGNHNNAYQSLKRAAEEDVRYIYLIEDDIMVTRDYFRWSTAVQEKFNPFVVGGYHQSDKSRADGDPAAVSRRNDFIFSFALCWTREAVRQFLPELERSKAPVDGLLNNSSRSSRLMLTPMLSRCEHYGHYGMTRGKPMPTDTLGEKLKAVRKLIPASAIPPWNGELYLLESRLLIAVCSCQRDKRLGYHDRIRKSWGKYLEDVADIRFFMGDSWATLQAHELDEVQLSVPDDYMSLPLKTKGICNWMLESGYSNVFKCDCDTTIMLHDFKEFPYQQYDYAGRFFYNQPGEPQVASGGGYFLSRKAARIVVDFEYKGWAEDVMVGEALHPMVESGDIKLHHIDAEINTCAAGRGAPHEPKKVFVYQVLLKHPGKEPKVKSVTRQQAEYLVKNGLAELISPGVL